VSRGLGDVYKRQIYIYFIYIYKIFKKRKELAPV
jgi:hypothetical protein